MPVHNRSHLHPSCPQEGASLKRLLPWLWPLADSSAPAAALAAGFPTELRQQLLAALAAYQVPSSNVDTGQDALGCQAIGDLPFAGGGQATTEDKRELLLSALRAVWDQ